MDRALRPERLETDPNQPGAAKDWQHWRRTFENYVDVLTEDTDAKFQILPNFLSPLIYQYIEESPDYTTALSTLEAVYVKPANEIYARHVLATRKQQSSETLAEYLQVLRSLSKDCNFQDVSAVRHRDESIRDAFIAGIQSGAIRQRLLEHKTLDLKSMSQQAQSLEAAAQNTESFAAPPGPTFNAAIPDSRRVDAKEVTGVEAGTSAAIPSKNGKCFFCGNAKHFRSRCPACEATCMKCHKRGHYARVCRGTATTTPA